jgi:GT2 family glycosyltransferase
MAKRCDIIIPVWNQLEVTRECVNSIVKHTDYPYRLVIIDNASDTPTADYLKGLKGEKYLDLLLIRNEKNLGFVKAVNQGIAVSDAPYLCIMNNDTIATAGWLDELVAVMVSRPEIGLLNPSSNTSGQFPGKMTIDGYAASLAPLKGQIQELYTCRGFCMLLKREVADRVGLLDEVYHIGYFDDTDYCKRAQGMGYRTARAKASYVYHKENVSFKAHDNNNELFRSNEKIFFERWGRHVRIGYFLDHIGSKSEVDDIAISVARQGHQILFFIKKGLEWPVSIDHFDIRRLPVNPLLFKFVSVYKIFKRKKKKPIEVLLTDSESFGGLLTALKGLHGADVLVRPSKEQIMAIIEKKSREF